MNPRDERKLTDEERERNEKGDIGRTADGEPLVDRGTADSARDPEENKK